MIGVYVRVSTVGQNVAGQKREIQRWLDGNEMSNARWFIDKASGDDLERPGFEDLEAAVFAGEIKTVDLYFPKLLPSVSVHLPDSLVLPEQRKPQVWIIEPECRCDGIVSVPQVPVVEQSYEWSSLCSFRPADRQFWYFHGI